MVAKLEALIPDGKKVLGLNAVMESFFVVARSMHVSLYFLKCK